MGAEYPGIQSGMRPLPALLLLLVALAAAATEDELESKATKCPKDKVNKKQLANLKKYTAKKPNGQSDLSCPCWWDLTRNNCACCRNGGKQCGFPMHKYCQSPKSARKGLGCVGIPVLLRPEQDGLRLVQEQAAPVRRRQEVRAGLRLRQRLCGHQCEGDEEMRQPAGRLRSHSQVRLCRQLHLQDQEEQMQHRLHWERYPVFRCQRRPELGPGRPGYAQSLHPVALLLGDQQLHPLVLLAVHGCNNVNIYS